MVTKAKKTKLVVPKRTKVPVAIGFDLSLSSLAGCAKMYDPVLKELRGPVWLIDRWKKDVPFNDRLLTVSRAHIFVIELLSLLGGIVKEADDIHIAVEQPPLRIMNANRLAQQSMMFGSFVGGLLRYGYKNVFPANIMQWQEIVANDLGIKVNKDFDKWTVKNWAIEVYGMEKWPDLIRNNKLGLIPKPQGSVAMPEQPDDRFDATGIMEYAWEKANGRV